METLMTVLHIFVGLVLIVVVLLQTGKGNAMGSAFGGGSSQTVFGASGAGNFLTKFTTAAAAIFMITSLTLSSFSSRGEKESLLDNVETPAPISSPATSLPALPAETGEETSPATGATESSGESIPTIPPLEEAKAPSATPASEGSPTKR